VMAYVIQLALNGDKLSLLRVDCESWVDWGET
jgi:hypothetical protein